MYKPIKKKNNAGYSLVELAIVMAILGTFVATAVGIYHNNAVVDKKEKTETNVVNIATALGAFREVYGRYPCPASLTAIRTNSSYGKEDPTCKAQAAVTIPNYPVTGCSSGGVCWTQSINPVPANYPIVIGALPFKTMGLREEDVYDSYGHRLSYAITAPLTNPNTFDMARGGITVVDENGNSIVTPDNSAHFVVVSPGENGIGSYTRAGVIDLACAGGSPDEQENCNNDEKFVFGSRNAGFDDRVQYFSPIALGYWQKADTTFSDVFLRKGGDNMVIGAQPSDNLTLAKQVEVLELGVDSGNVTARTNHVMSNYLCDHGADAANVNDLCFKSSLIGGFIAQGKGMTCGNAFIIGIKDGGPICSENIYVSCPDGSFISGIDNTGKIICTEIPTGFCPATNMVSSCGEMKAIPFSMHGTLQTTLSGQCYWFADQAVGNTPYWQNWFALAPRTPADVIAQVATINATPRVQSDCNGTELARQGTSALVRDTYKCNNGTWDPIVAQERWYNSSPFPIDRESNAQPFLAETTVPYDINYDPNRTTGDHDCWCRQDLAVDTNAACGNGYAAGGSKTVIYYAHCPSTADGFWEMYQDLSGCTCDGTGMDYDFPTCADYYNDPASGYNPVVPSTPEGIEGTVVKYWGRKCVAGVSVRDPDVTFPSDTGQCFCRPKDPVVDTTPCPAGTTNTYHVDGEATDRQNVQTVTIDKWICPGNEPDGFPKPGYWEYDYTPNDVPPCTCSGEVFRYEDEPCPSNLAGDGTRWKRFFDCATGQWDMDDSHREWVSTDCRTCNWKSSETPSPSQFALGNQIGSNCSCDSQPGNCHDFGPNSQYNVWSNCQCVVKPRTP